ncbi:hypothetical protein DM860_014544 [Cuscuta australis]|uniref:Uncharacterized protein n=1 Tax=Cuscuta australis TaxID=267555 RepID=A0A328DY20_9ASTE|nr:hypothetical protein DM860_014544 [Cuscuta australis]
MVRRAHILMYPTMAVTFSHIPTGSSQIQEEHDQREIVLIHSGIEGAPQPPSHLYIRSGWGKYPGNLPPSQKCIPQLKAIHLRTNLSIRPLSLASSIHLPASLRRRLTLIVGLPSFG